MRSLRVKALIGALLAAVCLLALPQHQASAAGSVEPVHSIQAAPSTSVLVGQRVTITAQCVSNCNINTYANVVDLTTGQLVASCYGKPVCQYTVSYDLATAHVYQVREYIFETNGIPVSNAITVTWNWTWIVRVSEALLSKALGEQTAEQMAVIFSDYRCVSAALLIAIPAVISFWDGELTYVEIEGLLTRYSYPLTQNCVGALQQIVASKN
ncbi:MAG TPA: hypothetical protein VFB58_10975 [Chloroflexota bacterium]|nr:hypothetical protein [Chloroflexota bacterium]